MDSPFTTHSEIYERLPLSSARPNLGQKQRRESRRNSDGKVLRTRI